MEWSDGRHRGTLITSDEAQRTIALREIVREELQRRDDPPNSEATTNANTVLFVFQSAQP